MKQAFLILICSNILILSCSSSQVATNIFDIVYLPTHYSQDINSCDPTHVDPKIGMWSRSGAQHIIDENLTVFDPEVIFGDETTTMYKTFSAGSLEMTKELGVMNPSKFNVIALIALITVTLVFVCLSAFVGYSSMVTLIFAVFIASLSCLMLISFGHDDSVMVDYLEPGLVSNSSDNPLFYTNKVKFYDNGKNGDAVKDDGVYTKTCIKSIYDFNVYDDSLTVYSELPLRILHPKLRNALPVQRLSESVAMTEYGFFIGLGPDYMDVYQDSLYLSHPEYCLACHTAFEVAGDQFDFFVVTPRSGAPDYAYYIRVHDGIAGIGLPEEWRSHDYQFPDGDAHQKLQGIIYMNDMMNWAPLNHELGHWIGLGPDEQDFPSKALAWNLQDGTHLHGNSTAESLLSTPVWNMQEYSYSSGTGKQQPILLDNGYGETFFARLAGTPQSGFYLEPRLPKSIVYDDIFLYMMGLLPAEQIDDEYWQVSGMQLTDDVECFFNDREFFQDVCQGPFLPITYSEAVKFDTQLLINQFGKRVTRGSSASDTFNVGFLHTSHRPFTEAEIIFRSLAIKDWIRTDSVSETEVIENYTWHHVTQGKGKIATNFIGDLHKDTAEYEKWLNYTYTNGKLIRKE